MCAHTPPPTHRGTPHTLHALQDWCSAEFYDDHCQRCKCKGCGFCREGPKCFSSVAGDSDHAACESFCAADYAESHCAMCKCKQCGFCSAVAPKLEAAAEGRQACTPSSEDDVSVLDCQEYCSVEYRDSHCASCKCKGCAFCGCTSKHEGDAQFEGCADWCSVDYFHEHCDWCACRNCQFCKTGPPCDSFLPEDKMYETCDAFCEAPFAATHCEFCKCKQCDFCLDTSTTGAASTLAVSPASAALPLPSATKVEATNALVQSKPACDSGIGGDADHPTCERFCNKMGGAAHCRMCKCQACDFCVGVCASGLVGDTDYASCEPACDEIFAEEHCMYCRCKGCKFCAKPVATSAAAQSPPGAACSSLVAGDTAYEGCEQSSCGQLALAGRVEVSAELSERCATCRCKVCPQCLVSSAPSELAIAAAPPCSSRWVDDVTEALCQDFCHEGTAEIHCTMCKCRGCDWCKVAPPAQGDTSSAATTAAGGGGPVALDQAGEVVGGTSPRQPCSSGILGDTTYAACFFVCDPNFAAALCIQARALHVTLCNHSLTIACSCSLHPGACSMNGSPTRVYRQCRVGNVC